LNQWMYYDYIRKALQGNRKIIIDPTCGIPELWMNFYEIIEDEKMIEKEKDSDKLIEYSELEKEKEYLTTNDFILEIKKQIEKGKSLTEIVSEIDFGEIKKQGLDVNNILKNIREMVMENQKAYEEQLNMEKEMERKNQMN